jgi:hypothetical protein
MSGHAIEFSESVLTDCAAAYDPAKWRAPLVVGHPKTNAPAYGWVDRLDYSEVGLEATPGDVEPAFAELVNAKRYANISASFWSPDAPGNPTPGSYYLRHVGFLGAQPPALKGLREPEFGESEEGIVSFSEWDDVDNASLWRRLREWVIGRFGMDEADLIVPSYLVSGLEASAQQELSESLAEGEGAPASTAGLPAFSDPAQETRVTPEQAAALEAENAALRKRLADQETAQRHAAHVSFAEGLVTAGRLPPASLDMVVATLDYVGSADQVVEFGEGEAKAPLADGLRAFLEALPVAPEFAEEQATKDRAAGQSGVVSFAAPAGYAVDQDSALVHTKAIDYQKAHPGTEYLAAVAAVTQA